MNNISIHINIHGKGFFALLRGNRIIGKINFSLFDGELILLSTVVPCRRNLIPIGIRIIEKAVEYARMHELKVITVSKFVQMQFSINPVLYADVWEKKS